MDRAIVQRTVLIAASCSALACSAAPIAVERLEPQQAYLSLTRTALSGEKLSRATRIVLRRHDLLNLHSKDPEAALEALRAVYVSGDADSDSLFALAETALAHAANTKSSAHYLAAAMYAYAQLVPSSMGIELDPVDPRMRVNVAIYNTAIVGAFASEDGDTVEPKAGSYALPFGELTVSFDAAQLMWNGRLLSDFLPASHYDVRGLKNRYWRPGVGAPLTARAQVAADRPDIEGLVISESRVAMTAILRFDDVRPQLESGEVAATLELYPNNEAETVTIAGHELPLEAEPSVALAKTLVEQNPWQNEISAFVGKVVSRPQQAALSGLAPPRRNRIPLVFVHGTASSGARWADMINDIDADRDVRRAYQFWFFNYDSGNPIAHSGMKLRRALVELIGRLDPDGTNPCLTSMVVIGHSQGGLLTKLVAVDSGTRFWEAVSDKPFDEVQFSEETRESIREALFFEALPFIERVVFIATPHRGSFRARSGFVRRLARGLISLPGDLLKVSADLLRIRENKDGYLRLDRISTSIDNMSPGSPTLLVLEPIPIDPDITAHSIIPVLPHDGRIEEGNDGVVEYASAHLDGVESELVVESGHSTQSNPHTINEVLRILQLHLAESRCSSARPRTAGLFTH